MRWSRRGTAALLLVSVALAVRAVAADPEPVAGECEQDPGDRSAQGCFLKLGDFARAQAPQGSLDSIVARLGEPTAKQVTRRGGQEDGDLPDAQVDEIVLTYAKASYRLTCVIGGSECTLDGLDLYDPAPDLGCGLHVGVPIADLLKVVHQQSMRGSPEVIELYWDKYWREAAGYCAAEHANISLFPAAGGRLDRITWRFFPD